MGGLRIDKGQALGNDYLVVDRATLPWEATPERVQLICDRNRGVGSDGILIADLTDGIALTILNPDGSEAEKSGNGLRIFGAWLHGRGLVPDNEWFSVRLVKDTVRMRVEEHLAAGALNIRAEMGPARFEGRAVDFTPQPAEALGHPLDLGDGLRAEVTTVSLSNPHCVVFPETETSPDGRGESAPRDAGGSRWNRDDFLARAPRLCTHPAFAKGTNVQFARVLDDHTLEAWIWERGVGETLASGSSSCAVAAAAVRRGFVDHGTFTVRMPGGQTEVEVLPDFQIKLLGPAQIVFSCELSDGVMEGLRG